MRILLRADAGVKSGTGHVMRCLSLGEELLARGHGVELLGDLGGVAWLQERVAASGIAWRVVRADTLDPALVSDADRLVVDSYEIPAARVSEAARAIPTLAFVDGDVRGIEASLYVDQNLGAKRVHAGRELPGRMLAGSAYAMVRREIREQRRDDGWMPRSAPPRVVAFMGGSDPLGAIVPVVQSLLSSGVDRELVVVAAERWTHRVRDIAPSGVDVLAPTTRLPEILGTADIVVSAAGTSAWDICAMGRPAVLAAVAANQQASLREAVDARLVLGVDAAEDPAILAAVGPAVVALREDENLRRELVANGLRAFDGHGAARVADALEAAAVR